VPRSHSKAGRTSVTIEMLARIAKALGAPRSAKIGEEEAVLASRHKGAGPLPR